MKTSQPTKPLHYLKTHADHIIRELSENGGTVVITQNGEAKAVVQDIHQYEETQKSLAMLKILAMSRRSIDRGQIRPAGDVLDDLEQSIREDMDG